MPVARTLGADDALERARSRLEQPRYFPENEMAEIEGKAVAWLHVCNLFSFEVSANVMTMACITPKRNRLASEFCSKRRSSLVKLKQGKSSR